MKCGLKLISVDDPRHARLVVRRVAADLGLDIHAVEVLLSRLPADLLRHSSEENADRLAADYTKLGCRVQKIWENESDPKAAGPAAPPPVPHAHEPQVHVTPPPAPYSFHFSSRSAPTPLPKKRPVRDWVVLCGTVALIALVLFGVTRIKKNADIRPESGIQKDTLPAPEPSPRRPPAELDRRIAELGQKARDPGTPEQDRQELSGAYEERAEQETSVESRIHFYKFAVEFNAYNEAAWDGLIEALREAGRGDEAREAAQKKKELFKDANRRLSRVLNSAGALTDLPRIGASALTFTYRSRTTDPAALEEEMAGLAVKIRGVRHFRRIRMTAVGAAGEQTRDY